MSDKKETAVYWLIKQMSLKDVCKYSRQLGVAKGKEKQRIIEARLTAPRVAANQKFAYKKEAEQYYSETYEQ